jgi:hypothetical protein
MFDKPKQYLAYGFGVLTTIVGAGLLIDSLKPRVWLVALAVFIFLILAAFAKPLGEACANTIQFFQGALEARRSRQDVDQSVLPHPDPSAVFTKQVQEKWEEQPSCRLK